MKQKYLIILFIISILAIVTGLKISSGDAGSSSLNNKNLLSYAAKEVDLSRINSVSINTSLSDQAVTIERNDNNWQVKEAFGYPANVAALTDLLRELQSTKVVEQKTAKVEHHTKLNLSGLDSPDSKAVKLLLQGQDNDLAILVGKEASHGKGRYVRFEDSPQTYLVDSNIQLSESLNDWLEPKIFSVDYSHIRKVTLVRSGQIEFSASRPLTKTLEDNKTSNEESVVNLAKNAVEQTMELSNLDNSSDVEHAVLADHFELDDNDSDNIELKSPSIIDEFIRNLLSLEVASVESFTTNDPKKLTQTINIEYKSKHGKTDKIVVDFYSGDSEDLHYLVVNNSKWLIEIEKNNFNILTINKSDLLIGN